MSIFDSLQIAASGLTAQRLRMNVTASNIANASTTRDANGGTYEPSSVVFESVMLSASSAAPGVAAVAIVPSGSAAMTVYDPSNPDANGSGMVNKPGVDIASQMADMMNAVR